MSTQPKQSDILNGIMVGLAGIAKIPQFKPTNRDLVPLSTAILNVKAAASKWPSKADTPVASAVVDCYNATTAYSALSGFAKQNGYTVDGGTLPYYRSFLARASAAFRTAQESSDASIQATAAVFDPLNAGLDQLASAARTIVVREKELQKRIQDLEHQIASDQAAINKARETEHSWWFQLINGLTMGLADAIFELVNNVDGLQSKLGDAEGELEQDLNSFKIYDTAAPIAGTCSQLVQCLQQWSLGFYNTVGTLQALNQQIETGVQSGASAEDLRRLFGQMDTQCHEAVQALSQLESFQGWARRSLEANAVVLKLTDCYAQDPESYPAEVQGALAGR